MTNEPMSGPQDFRLLLEPEPFDPAEVTQPAGTVAAGAQATVVQFAALLSVPDINRLKAAYGLRLDRFIPNLAYLERLDTATADRVRADFHVRAVIPFPQASKLSPEIPGTGPLDLLAVLFDDADAAAVTTALTTIGAHDLATIDDREFGGRLRLLLTLDDATTLPQVTAIDDIIWLEPLPTITTHNVAAAQAIQSGSVGPQAGTIWDRGLHGENQVISVIDDGKLNINHCFFADTPNTPGPAHRKVLAVLDDSGAHGANFSEHMLTISAVAVGDELGNSGNHPNRGGAWAAKIVARNGLDLFNARIGRPISLRQALERSKNRTAAIHNLSWSNGNIERYESMARTWTISRSPTRNSWWSPPVRTRAEQRRTSRPPSRSTRSASRRPRPSPTRGRARAVWTGRSTAAVNRT